MDLDVDVLQINYFLARKQQVKIQTLLKISPILKIVSTKALFRKPCKTTIEAAAASASPLPLSGSSEKKDYSYDQRLLFFFFSFILVVPTLSIRLRNAVPYFSFPWSNTCLFLIVTSQS